MRRQSLKAQYDAWLARVVAELNRSPRPLRELTARDYPGVNFHALHRTGQTPETAAYIARVISQYSITA